MDHKGYLRNISPLALRWAELNNFEQYQLIDLATIIKLVHENGKEIPTSQVQKQEKIDKGSFGSIFKAKYQDRVYVMKCIGQGSSKLQEAVRPVLLELSAVIRVNHPKIVGFLGVVTFFPDESQKETAELGLLFEYCDNGNLFENLHRRRTLDDLNQRLDIACQIAEGMEYLHSLSIIHRDLNSNNVVLTKEMNAKICDFGCARTIGVQGHMTPTTISGSPSYMSPEQLTGSDKLTLQSDVWAMAVVVWELVSIRSPWVAIASDVNDTDLLSEMIVTQGQRLPPIPSKIMPEIVHAELSDLLDASFTEEPTRRPTMRDFGVALRSIKQRIDPERLDQLTNLPRAVPTQERTVPPRVLLKATSFVSTEAHQDPTHAKHPASEPDPKEYSTTGDKENAEAGDFRGVCPVCSRRVSSLHIGRVRDSDGDYFHFDCWESLAPSQEDQSSPSVSSMANPADKPIPGDELSQHKAVLVESSRAAAPNPDKDSIPAARGEASSVPKPAITPDASASWSWRPPPQVSTAAPPPRAADMVRTMPPRVKDKDGAASISAPQSPTRLSAPVANQSKTRQVSPGLKQSVHLNGSGSVNRGAVYVNSGGASEGDSKALCPVCGKEVTAGQARKRDSTGTRFVHSTCFEAHELRGLARLQPAAELALATAPHAEIAMAEAVQAPAYWQGSVGSLGVASATGGAVVATAAVATYPDAAISYTNASASAYVRSQPAAATYVSAVSVSGAQYTGSTGNPQYSGGVQYTGSATSATTTYSSSAQYLGDASGLSTTAISGSVQPAQYTSSVQYTSDVQPTYTAGAVSTQYTVTQPAEYLLPTTQAAQYQYSNAQTVDYSGGLPLSSGQMETQYSSTLPYASSVPYSSSTSYTSSAPYASSVPYSGSTSYTSSVPYSSSTSYTSSAPYASSVPYSSSTSYISSAPYAGASHFSY